MRIFRVSSSSQLTVAICFVIICLATFAPAQTPDLSTSVDRIVQQVLASTGVPSVSLAIVGNNKIIYAQAYGEATLEPKVLARPEMRYSIGSISKQFTATAILMLAEEGKLALDDPVSRF